LLLLSGDQRKTTPNFFEKKIELLLRTIVRLEAKDMEGLVNDLVDIQPSLTLIARVLEELHITD